MKNVFSKCIIFIQLFVMLDPNAFATESSNKQINSPHDVIKDFIQADKDHVKKSLNRIARFKTISELSNEVRNAIKNEADVKFFDEKLQSTSTTNPIPVRFTEKNGNSLEFNINSMPGILAVKNSGLIFKFNMTSVTINTSESMSDIYKKIEPIFPRQRVTSFDWSYLLLRSNDARASVEVVLTIVGIMAMFIWLGYKYLFDPFPADDGYRACDHLDRLAQYCNSNPATREAGMLEALDALTKDKQLDRFSDAVIGPSDPRVRGCSNSSGAVYSSCNLCKVASSYDAKHASSDEANKLFNRLRCDQVVDYFDYNGSTTVPPSIPK